MTEVDVVQSFVRSRPGQQEGLVQQCALVFWRLEGTGSGFWDQPTPRKRTASVIYRATVVIRARLRFGAASVA